MTQMRHEPKDAARSFLDSTGCELVVPVPHANDEQIVLTRLGTIDRFALDSCSGEHFVCVISDMATLDFTLRSAFEVITDYATAGR